MSDELTREEVRVRFESAEGGERPGEERTAEQGEVSPPILVAIDASPPSVAALHAAAELAALTGAELHGVFVEDVNLLYLGGFPFGREIGSYTATSRPIDQAIMERQLRIMASAVRDAVARAAARSRVRWSFEVRRGAIAAELLAAAQQSLLLGMGRTGYMRQRSLGSTARAVVARMSRPVLIFDRSNKLKYPLTVLYTGSPAAERALRFAASLARRREIELLVLVWDDPVAEPESDADRLQQQADQFLAEQGVTFRTVILRRGDELLAALRSDTIGTLLLPGERAALLSEHDGPAILVP